MRMRSLALIAACVTGAVASLGLVAIAPTWIGVAVAGTAAIGWCLYLEHEERLSNHRTRQLIRDRITAGGTVFVLRGTDGGAHRTIDETNRCAGDMEHRS
jgi:hypothetical protein